MRRIEISLLGLSLAFLFLPGAATAQNKLQQCASIQVSVDLNKGPGNWSNDVAILKLQEKGGGWVIPTPAGEEGKHIQAKKGQKYRLNFSDGHNRVEVKPSGGGGVAVESGSQKAIALVEIKAASGTQAVRFEITGSPAANAKINGCPGGSLYFDISG